MRGRSPEASFDRWDLLALGTLLLLWFCLLLLRYDALPLQIWDESRLANNAFEIVQSGKWLVPSYGGVPDHWNVKPPLLIWQMASLMWLGLPPLLAVRLPTMLAALATVLTMWAVCRYTLRDRVAAVLAAVLLLSSSYYTDIHIARTGDYDVPLGFLTLLYVVTFWLSVEQDREINVKWFAVFAIAVVLAIMTKGVAGAFGLVGLFLFTFGKGRLFRLIGNFRVWVLMLLTILLCSAYYLSRELYDPGYLQAVWHEELGGRFFVVNEGHVEGRRFYITILLWRFEPGMLLLPFVTITLLRAESRRRSMATVCLLSAAAILVVLTISRTKIAWYATPMVPFLALGSALGVADGIRWIEARESQLPKLFHARPLQVALGILLAAASAASIYRNQLVMPTDQASDPGYAQYWYGALFEELQARGNSSVIIVDHGVRSNIDYDPMLKFYADIARTKGLRAELIPPTETALPRGELLATCDPTLVPRLERQARFTVGGQVHSCIFGSVHF